MKKTILLLIVSIFLLCGCSSEEKTDDNAAMTITVTSAETAAESATTEPILELKGDTYVITEDKYYEGVLEIYHNADKYVGKRVEFEGEYIAELYVDEMYYQVYRYVTLVEYHRDEYDHVHTHLSEKQPLGFRINYDGDKPTDKSFVKVSGIVETYDNNGQTSIIINAEFLEKSENPGKVDLFR